MCVCVYVYVYIYIYNPNPEKTTYHNDIFSRAIYLKCFNFGYKVISSPICN